MTLATAATVLFPPPLDGGVDVGEPAGRGGDGALGTLHKFVLQAKVTASGPRLAAALTYALQSDGDPPSKAMTVAPSMKPASKLGGKKSGWSSAACVTVIVCLMHTVPAGKGEGVAAASGIDSITWLNCAPVMKEGITARALLQIGYLEVQ